MATSAAAKEVRIPSPADSEEVVALPENHKKKGTNIHRHFLGIILAEHFSYFTLNQLHFDVESQSSKIQAC